LSLQRERFCCGDKTSKLKSRADSTRSDITNTRLFFWVRLRGPMSIGIGALPRGTLLAFYLKKVWRAQHVTLNRHNNSTAPTFHSESELKSGSPHPLCKNSYSCSLTWWHRKFSRAPTAPNPSLSSEDTRRSMFSFIHRLQTKSMQATSKSSLSSYRVPVLPEKVSISYRLNSTHQRCPSYWSAKT
jgi:hypothetical protein